MVWEKWALDSIHSKYLYTYIFTHGGVGAV